jgi:glucose/arabinose dehydrogenase
LLDVEPVVSGLEQPVYVTHAGDDRLFVVEQPGQVRVIANGELLDTPFLDIVPLVNSNGFEQGLLSIAFHPNYATNGEFFVNYTRQPDGATIIARYRVSSDPNVADPNSAEVLLTIPQPERNHNGGLVKFGPDGYLYIGMGDGGGAGDRHGTIGNGQDPNALLGKLLRMNVETGEVSIWAMGLRNPWRFSFDRATGDLYIADVGQGDYEEINFQPASSAGGENYGWRIMEGAHCFDPGTGCDQTGLVLPVAEYNHAFGCSVTGGYVYRGSAYPWLNGVYVFADYCTGIVWSLARDASGAWDMQRRMDVSFTVSSFGEDLAGELYLTGHTDGTVYRLTSTSP